MRDDRQRLRDILEAIERIEPYARGGREEFEADELVHTFVVHYIQLIGEAAGALSQELTSAHPQVPWSEITGMRHVLVHDYFAIDLERVWLTVERDLPELKRQISAILEQLPSAE